MITLNKINEYKYNVLWENGKHIGTFELGIDGMFYFWGNTDNYGSWTSYSLRAIADKLDKINKPFQDTVDKYFEQEKIKEGLIGKTLKSAEKELEGKGYEIRITKVGNTVMAITDDFIDNRLNLEIENGVITNVYNG